MNKHVGIVCGSYHKEEVERMLMWAQDEARTLKMTVGDVVWVNGSMEVPLALDRMMETHDGAVCLGIIEKGETQHGLAMGQAVMKTILELQLKYNKPIGLGIIGPGAESHHIEPRLEPHARASIRALL
ncbi:MAG: 6,7-dimethyl-8-ribityllumazine synthase [Euryarchaeota archaeon]|nr:6,7-dimethyl-8-ribityllumazine synthase [Euryarchaeota archaeon]